MNDTIKYMANTLLPIVEEYSTKDEPFKFLAYFCGVRIVMELANILEFKGYTGRVIYLDGSPLLITEMTNILNFQSEENLQIALIYQILYNLYFKSRNFNI